ncbi:hypothetical protein TRVA0_034S01574 [Trichomonascus vanleenenianus]|uniref:uncharacterized protein n=1 Tax=Trichomonascus vanleenenianus TaxID=2268995 RepID=UPI003ECB0FBE
MEVSLTLQSKPPAPYVMDMKFTVQQHIAPPPLPEFEDCGRASDERLEEGIKLTWIERSLRHPPLAGELGTGTLDLEVVDTFKVGDGHNAQVFIVEARSALENIQPGQKLVAKVYDPLYLNVDEGYFDPFYVVDEHYSREVHFYHEFSDYQGGLIPKFYGSFSLDLRIPESFLRGIDSQGLKTRQVRLILIELIPGSSMYQTSPKDFTQQARQQMMKSVIDFKTLVYQRGVTLNDLWSRNIIVTSSEISPERKLVFVDFAMIVFRDSILPKSTRVNRYIGTYVSPLLRWDSYMVEKFNDWIDWQWKPWLDAKYAHTEKFITEKMRDRFKPRFFFIYRTTVCSYH